MTHATETRVNRGYRPIADYAVIGNCHSAALVALDGSMDWCCLPRFDSPAVFCRILDSGKGGYFRVGPRGRYAAKRTYIEDTNVLVTTFTTADGAARLTDLMAAQPLPGEPGELASSAVQHSVLRLVEGLAGEVEMEVAFQPAFQYASTPVTFEPCPGGAVVRAGAEMLVLGVPAELQADASGTLVGTLRIRAGQRVWVTLSYRRSGEPTAVLAAEDAEALLERTLTFWESWSRPMTYRGPYAGPVRRSALVLKLLTYAPTGALVAAPTTSLPEEIGGVRNWDYRYTWLRDSAFMLDALMDLNQHEEAMSFWSWLESLAADGPDVRIMYRIDGQSELAERTLDHLEGYRGSRPVRVGNGAAGQRQLDIYGELLQAAYVCHERMQAISPGFGRFLASLADQAAARWREPDQGIWEVRGGPRHFLYSKLMCWVALDRAVRLARRLDLPGPLDHWRSECAAIRQAIETEGFDAENGAFTQAFGQRALDASALAIPLVGFLPATDPRVVTTVARIQEQLTANGLVYRYSPEQADDGLSGGEATFALCSFWLVQVLALQGRVQEARGLFERVVGYANDVGLMSEEIDPSSGELLGNFPQGFTHLALIRAALAIRRAETARA